MHCGVMPTTLFRSDHSLDQKIVALVVLNIERDVMPSFLWASPTAGSSLQSCFKTASICSRANRSLTRSNLECSVKWSTTLNILPSGSPNGDYRGHLGSRLLRHKTTCNCSTQLDATWVVSMKRFTQLNTPPSGSPTGTTTRI